MLKIFNKKTRPKPVEKEIIHVWIFTLSTTQGSNISFLIVIFLQNTTFFSNTTYKKPIYY